MANQSTIEQRIRSLYQMLFEMATGNLHFRLTAQFYQDDLDRLTQLLNQLAENIQTTFLQHGYVTPFYHYQNLVQLTLIIDQEFTIIACSSASQDFLGWKNDDIIGVKIDLLFDEASSKSWHKTKKNILKTPDFHSTLHLIFKTNGDKLVPSFCTVSRLLYTDMIVVSSITTSLQEIIYDVPRPKTGISLVSEAETMQQLHDYILENLGNQLPTIPQLSKLFKINEFDLKRSFKLLFHTSIHHFYNEERLKRAHLMVTQTNDTLKVIAVANGFQNYTSFNKSFKQRFGYAPSQLKRNAQ